MNKKQRLYLFISIVVVSSGLLLSGIYRPYIYSNDINDYSFADTIGSLVSVIGFCSFLWSFNDINDNKKKLSYYLDSSHLQCNLGTFGTTRYPWHI